MWGGNGDTDVSTKAVVPIAFTTHQTLSPSSCSPPCANTSSAIDGHSKRVLHCKKQSSSCFLKDVFHHSVVTASFFSSFSWSLIFSTSQYTVSFRKQNLQVKKSVFINCYIRLLSCLVKESSWSGCSGVNQHTFWDTGKGHCLTEWLQLSSVIVFQKLSH